MPLCAAQLGLQLMNLVDVAVVGRLGEVPLAAVGLATGLHLCLFVLGMGVMMGFEPLVAQALGAGNPLRARQLFWQGVVLAACVTLVLTPLALLLPLRSCVAQNLRPDVALFRHFSEAQRRPPPCAMQKGRPPEAALLRQPLEAHRRPPPCAAQKLAPPRPPVRALLLHPLCSQRRPPP